MLRGAALFVGWTILGTVLTYASLYAFTPFGLAIFAICLPFAIGLSRAGRGTNLELLGLIAGAGAFFAFASANADQDVASRLLTAGIALIVLAVVAYAVAARRACGRPSPR